MLTQIGISTGSLNADWGTIKEGKLVVNEEKLKEAIVQNPDGVKEFFGSDNDADNRVDNGLAFRVGHILRPYIMSGKSIIQSKIDLENSSLEMASKKIERHRDHLKKYESKLRAKFGAMEKALSGAKNQSSWLNQQFKGLNLGDKSKK